MNILGDDSAVVPANGTRSIAIRFCIDRDSISPAVATAFARHGGVARAAWNWALADFNVTQRAVQELVDERAVAEGQDDETRVAALRADETWREAAYKSAKKAALDAHPEFATGVGMIATGYRFRPMTREEGSPWAWWHAEKHGVQKLSVNLIFDDLRKAISRSYQSRPPSNIRQKPRADGMRPGWPRFKSKHDPRSAFALVGGTVQPVISAHRVQLPIRTSTGARLTLRVHEHTKKLQSLIAKGAITTGKTIRVYRRGGRWYLVFVLEVPVGHLERSPTRRQREAGGVGIDQGVTQRLALSDGSFVANPRLAAAQARRIRRMQRSMDRKRAAGAPGAEPSARYKRVRDRYAAAQRSLATARAGFLHRETDRIATRYVFVAVEDLHVRNMTRTAKGTLVEPGARVRQKAGLNRAILDAGFGAAIRMLEYKTRRSGAGFVKVDAAYTSQTCHQCGYTSKESRESQARFRCVQCGHTANADTNAALNVLALARSQLASDAGRVETRAEGHLPGTASVSDESRRPAWPHRTGTTTRRRSSTR